MKLETNSRRKIENLQIVVKQHNSEQHMGKRRNHKRTLKILKTERLKEG
jgi:hypothetical protein